MKFTVVRQTANVKIWPGPYMQTTPMWQTVLTDWIYKKFPDPNVLKIESISQREDEKAFNIDLTINGTIKAYISMYAQRVNPKKDDIRPYVIYTSIPLPLKEYYSIVWIYPISTDPNYTIVSENEKKITAENDLLVKLMSEVGYETKYFTKDRSLIRIYDTGDHRTNINNKLPEWHRVMYSPELETMILQFSCALHLYRRKKGVKLSKIYGVSSFYGIYEFLMPRYNVVISNLDALNNFYKS